MSEVTETERPWVHGLPDDGDAVPCDECGKMIDIEEVRGTFYARCSCCINSQLLRVGECYNDTEDHRHCRRWGYEMTDFNPDGKPHNRVCTMCAEAAA